MKANRKVSVKIPAKICEEYAGVFTGIGYFKGTCFLQVKNDAKPYQVTQGV